MAKVFVTFSRRGVTFFANRIETCSQGTLIVTMLVST